MKINGDFTVLIFHILLSILIFASGIVIGKLNTETKINNKARDLAREKFTNAISWAISENILIVNSNKVKELKLDNPNF